MHPADMDVERSSAQLRVSFAEVTVASFRPRRGVRSGSSSGSSWIRIDAPRDPSGTFPTDGVAFRIVSREGGPAPNVDVPETRFPVRLSSFRRSTAYADVTPRPLERTIVADGANYEAFVWIGTAAPAARRAALARVVASLSFPRLRVGQTVGYGFHVFARSSRYRVGSFRRVRVQRQPYYLVRAPGGFYGIGWRWENLAGGYKSRCDLRLDRRRKEFFCTNLRARWDRVGRVLVRPPSAARGDPLNLSLVKRAWDGHVLLYPDARFADATLEQELWPRG